MPPASIRPPKLAAVATVTALLAAALPAAAQTLTYALSPSYQEGVNGANGWYRVPVSVAYTCLPGTLLVVSCPANETLQHYAGTVPGPTTRRIPAPIVRSAVFQAPPVAVEPGLPEPPPAPPITVNVTLTLPTGSGVKVDAFPPGAPTVRVPAAGATYDAGSVHAADFDCPADVTSGPPPGSPCVGTVPDGANLPTGTADRASTYGTKAFTVRAIDAAGNVSTRTVNYTVDELPGTPTLNLPAASATVDARSTFTWSPPADDGSGVREYRFTVTPSRGTARTYTIRPSGSGPVSFQPPADLPAGSAGWAVTFVDVRDRTAVSASRAVTLRVNIPAAPKLLSPPAMTTVTEPTFSWAPAEPGGTFTWEIATATGAVIQGPLETAATTARAAPLRPGGYSFRVRQVNVFGRPGAWSDRAPFTVEAVQVSAAPPATLPVATPATIVPPKPATPAGPPTQNPKRLTPRAGAGLRSAPVLRWQRARKATLYNVQVFRVAGRRYVKVFSGFPRGTSLRIPKARLAPGNRFVWRVWPYDGTTKRYATRPVGVSWFALKASARR